MRILVAAALLALATTAIAGDRPGDPPFQTRSAVLAQNGIAATAQPLATQAALEILRAGGSAVDAAIAANAVLGLVEPVGNGVGGDLFALVWDPQAKALAGLDASGFAPAATDVAAMRARNSSGTIRPMGLDPVTVPGAVAGWEALHARFGKLPLATVLEPAVRLARDGFPVSPVIARQWATNLGRFEAAKADITRHDLAVQVYAPAGRAPKAGEIFRNPDLADTLEAIGAKGAAGFYAGATGAAIDAHMRATGGPMRLADLAAMKAEWVVPISAPYRGHVVWQMPPATQGVATLQILRLVERFDVKSMGFGSADHVHLMVEAKKLAFADRAKFIADPRKVPVPVKGLLSDAYTAERAALIRMDRANPDAMPAGDPGERSDTTYLATADRDGMMVSLIQSNYRGMGSGIVAAKAGGRTLGFMFQNRGAQFSLNPAAANVIAPMKRPFHTIIPGFVTKDGEAWAALGVMGGAMQPQGQAQVIVNMIDFGMDVQQAGDAPRFRHIGGADPGDGIEQTSLFLESQISAETRAELQRRGHVLKTTRDDVGGYQAIRRDPVNRVYWGGSDMRKDGQAAGF